MAYPYTVFPRGARGFKSEMGPVCLYLKITQKCYIRRFLKANPLMAQTLANGAGFVEKGEVINRFVLNISNIRAIRNTYN